MFLRVAIFLLVAVAVSAVVAATAGPLWGGACLFAVLVGFLLRDRQQAGRMLSALRGDALGALPQSAGAPWGELSQRIVRLLRDREARLAQSEARLQEFLVALEDSPNGVVLLDEKGRIEWCNQTAARHFGFDAVSDQLQYIGNLVRDPLFAAYMASWNYSRDVVLTVAVDASLPLRLSVQAHPYAGNRRLLLSRDVTAVEQAEAMRRDFVANVSHEIRTPLTVLAGFVETMQNLPLKEDERAAYLGLMAQQAHRMQTLVNDLLTLSRLEGSPPPGQGEWTAVDALLAQSEQEARALGAALGKQHEFGPPAAAGQEVAGAAAELLSAMSNLASNAVRYTPAGGTIHIDWQPVQDGRAAFSVRDTGPGIAPEHLSRLTERFYRVDRSRSRETGGTGLGLAIVKHVVQRHGAELKIESTPGVGSTFTMVFPASRLRPVTPPAGTSARPATESAAAR